jgi:translocator protein
VWSVLFIMIAIAGWMVWRHDPTSTTLWLWGVQLIVNAGWSALFFGRRRMDLAFYDVVLLWLLIAAFIASASSATPIAALLFAPYLLWVTIAGTLNWTVWRMNSA